MAFSSNQEIESRGATVDAAVSAGLERLGVTRDQVKVIVIDEGSRGLLGIGSREAIVRLIVTPAEDPATKTPAPPPPAAQAPTPVRETPKPAPTVASKPAPRPVQQPQTSGEGAEDEDDASTDTPANLESEKEVAVEIISTLIDKMHVKGEVSGYTTEPDDLTGQRVNMIEIKGDDLGVLIGPRGETLDSLQFLSRRMVAHRLHRRANFVVDVEGFRQRREQALTRLAERMADKARQRGEPIGLEPMSAYERRIIHMTLRNSEFVYTESTGEGKQRRVRIIPKQ